MYFALNNGVLSTIVFLAIDDSTARQFDRAVHDYVNTVVFLEN